MKRKLTITELKNLIKKELKTIQLKESKKPKLNEQADIVWSDENGDCECGGYLWANCSDGPGQPCNQGCCEYGSGQAIPWTGTGSSRGNTTSNLSRR